MILHYPNPLPVDLDKLATIFIKYKEIKAVYLFGSAATGKTHYESDLDLAVLSDDPKFKKYKLDIWADLVENGYDNVDLVFLDGSDIVLMYEAVKHNRLIYSRKDFDSNAFFSRIIRQYLDFLPYIKVQIDAYKKGKIIG